MIGLLSSLAQQHAPWPTAAGASISDGNHWANNSYTTGRPMYINPSDTFQNWMSTVVLTSGAKSIITINYGSNAATTAGALIDQWPANGGTHQQWKFQ